CKEDYFWGPDDADLSGKPLAGRGSDLVVGSLVQALYRSFSREALRSHKLLPRLSRIDRDGLLHFDQRMARFPGMALQIVPQSPEEKLPSVICAIVEALPSRGVRNTRKHQAQHGAVAPNFQGVFVD